MPVFTDIDERIQRPPFDGDAYRSRLPAAQTAAARMNLVHVTAVPHDATKWNVFVSILTNPPHEIPTSVDADYCSAPTRIAEDLLGHARSVYFYAGRAHPSFGNLALAFDSNCQQGRTGSATPFDTGGFVCQPTPHIKVRLLPNDDLPQRVAYCSGSNLKLDEWRDVFARILAAYFGELSEYWTGSPAPYDPEGLYELNSEWRCWSFEIRLYEPQPIHDRAAWCADEAVMQKLLRLYDDEAMTPGDPMPIDRFLNKLPALEPAGTPFYCNAVENWVRGELGI